LTVIFGDARQVDDRALEADSFARISVMTNVASSNPASDIRRWCYQSHSGPAERLLHGNWCLGQASGLGEISFVNQVDGGAEWLTIRGRTPFESITMKTFIESREEAEPRLYRIRQRIQQATAEQCRSSTTERERATPT